MHFEGVYYICAKVNSKLPDDIYYFTGNFSKEYPPEWSWRRDLGAIFARENIADAMARKLIEIGLLVDYQGRIPEYFILPVGKMVDVGNCQIRIVNLQEE